MHRSCYYEKLYSEVYYKDKKLIFRKSMILPKNTMFINTKDMIIDIVEHAVKVTHTPTNTVIECTRYKSYYKNKIEAIIALKKILQGNQHKIKA